MCAVRAQTWEGRREGSEMGKGSQAAWLYCPLVLGKAKLDRKHRERKKKKDKNYRTVVGQVQLKW